MYLASWLSNDRVVGFRLTIHSTGLGAKDLVITQR